MSAKVHMPDIDREPSSYGLWPACLTGGYTEVTWNPEEASCRKKACLLVGDRASHLLNKRVNELTDDERQMLRRLLMAEAMT